MNKTKEVEMLCVFCGTAYAVTMPESVDSALSCPTCERKGLVKFFSTEEFNDTEEINPPRHSENW